MPLLIAILGIVLLASAINGRSGYLLQTVQSEFTGPQNMLIWLGSLGAIGAIGYIPGFRTAANWLLALVLVSMFIANSRGSSGGFFAEFNQAIRSTTTAQPSATGSSDSYNSVPGVFGDIPTVQSPVYPSLPTPQPFGSNTLVF